MKKENQKTLSQDQKIQYLEELKARYGENIRLREIIICETPLKDTSSTK